VGAVRPDERMPLKSSPGAGDPEVTARTFDSAEKRSDVFRMGGENGAFPEPGRTRGSPESGSRPLCQNRLNSRGVFANTGEIER